MPGQSFAIWSDLAFNSAVASIVICSSIRVGVPVGKQAVAFHCWGSFVPNVQPICYASGGAILTESVAINSEPHSSLPLRPIRAVDYRRTGM